MRILVLLQAVPDLTGDLQVTPDGLSLAEPGRGVLNEFDEWALEEALQLQAAGEGEVHVLVPQANGARDILAAAWAKGARRVFLLPGSWDGIGNWELARAVAWVVQDLPSELILTGMQSPKDADAGLGMLLAGFLRRPHVNGVRRVSLAEETAVVEKELAQGMVARFAVRLPAVLGLIGARTAPRYLPLHRLRQAAQTVPVEELPAVTPSGPPLCTLRRLLAPPPARPTTFLRGDPSQVAGQLVAVLREQHIGRWTQDAR